MSQRSGWQFLSIALVTVVAAPALAQPPAAAQAPTPADSSPVLTVRAVRPDRQLSEVIGLFGTAEFPHPAAALAAWKQREGYTASLGKSLDALIALFNPQMIPELATLNEAELALGFGPRGEVRWWATVPHDDGTLSAMLMAAELTERGREAPLGTYRVLRLGPPGSPLGLARPGLLAIASSRLELERALRPSRDARAAADALGTESGWLFEVEPTALGAAEPLAWRRIGLGLETLGCDDLHGLAWLGGGVLAMTIHGDFARPPFDAAPIDPTWLNWVPAERTIAAISVSTDSRREAWSTLLSTLDRIDRADPARSKLAPLPTRLGLLSLGMGVSLERDVWSPLRGATAFAAAEPNGRLAGALAILHASDESAATRLAESTLPRLIARLTGSMQPPPPTADSNGPRQITTFANRPVRIDREGSSVLVEWGGSLIERAREVHTKPALSAAASWQARWGNEVPQRTGLLWLQNVPGMLEQFETARLRTLPPVAWWGRQNPDSSRDELRWELLDAWVKHGVEVLPLEPVANASTPARGN